MVWRMKNFNIFGVHWKIWLLSIGVMKNQYKGRNCLEIGAWTVCQFKGGFARKRGLVFLKGDWYQNAHYGQTDGKSDPPKENQYFEQSPTLFGMEKKERIVNQILLYKLRYMGQIYTIPKFIKGEIEKTIAPLSIWKCGLGILDIETQLNSLELQ